MRWCWPVPDVISINGCAKGVLTICFPPGLVSAVIHNTCSKHIPHLSSNTRYIWKSKDNILEISSRRASLPRKGPVLKRSHFLPDLYKWSPTYSNNNRIRYPPWLPPHLPPGEGTVTKTWRWNKLLSISLCSQDKREVTASYNKLQHFSPVWSRTAIQIIAYVYQK